MELSTEKPTIVCLTPVKNEAWILDRFLKCASMWADHIIIIDQMSTDGSREIAKKFPKVQLLDNPSTVFNEPEFRGKLLEEARKIPGQKLLIALDADEMLSANFLTSPEWQTLLQASPGTVIKLDRANIRPDFNTYWQEYSYLIGFMDNGSEFSTENIHGPRIPLPKNSPVLYLRDIKVLHYQYVNWDRMKSKHRWYVCWEQLNRPYRRATDIFRQYHHMYAVSQSEILPLPDEWFSEYIESNVDMTSIRSETVFWWDRQVLEWIDKYGSAQFRKVSIWDVDWCNIADQVTYPSSDKFKDPRNLFERWVHRWLMRTNTITSKFHVRLLNRLLRLAGW